MANDDRPPVGSRVATKTREPRHLNTVPCSEHARTDSEDDQSTRYSLGPCRDCGAYGPQVIVVPAVKIGKRRESVMACPSHSTAYVSRCGDLDWLARRRAAGTSETVEHARAALSGGGRSALRGPA